MSITNIGIIKNDLDFDNFLKSSNIKLEDLWDIEINLGDVVKILDKEKFVSNIFIFALKEKNEYLIKRLIDPDNFLNTKVGFTPSSINTKIKNNKKLLNIINDKNFYDSFPEENITLLFKIINDLSLETYGKKKFKYLSPLQENSFLKYALPIILRNRLENILNFSLIPLFNSFDNTTTSIMKNNSWEDINFLFKTIKKNKKDLLLEIEDLGSSYNAKEIKNILTNGQCSLLYFLNPKILYESINSVTVNTQNIFIEKFKNLISLSNMISSFFKDSIFERLEEESLFLESGNLKSHKKNKKTPFSLAVDKNLMNVVKEFIELGYSKNKIEDDYLQIKNIYNNKKDNSNIFKIFRNAIHMNSQASLNRIEELLKSASKEEKEELFYNLMIDNKNKDKTTTILKYIDLNNKDLKSQSDSYGVVSYAILNNKIEFLLKILESGYKLSEKEFCLIVFPLSRDISSSLSNNIKDFENVKFTIINYLKDYPISYKKALLDFSINYINIENEKNSYSKLDFCVYLIIKDDKIKNLHNNRINKLKGFLSYYMEKENLISSKISVDSIIDKLRFSLLVKKVFLKCDENKEIFDKEMEKVFSFYIKENQPVKERLSAIVDQDFKYFYNKGLIKNEKDIIKVSLLEKNINDNIKNKKRI